MAPPPPSKCSPVELPCANVMFCAVSLEFAWSWQCDVVHICRLSRVSMYRIQRMPAPLSVTFPPPSITTLELVLRTFAVARMTNGHGRGTAAEGDDAALGHRVTTVVRREEGRDLCLQRQLRASLPRRPGRRVPGRRFGRLPTDD